jgi:hypothetical protein
MNYASLLVKRGLLYFIFGGTPRTPLFGHLLILLLFCGSLFLNDTKAALFKKINIILSLNIGLSVDDRNFTIIHILGPSSLLSAFKVVL